MKKAKLLLMLALVLPMVAWGQDEWTEVVPTEGDYTWSIFTGEGMPQADSQGKMWYEEDYDDSGWSFSTHDLVWSHGSGRYARIQFNLSEVKNNVYYYLNLGIPCAFYINGHFISQTISEGGFNSSCYHIIPQAVLRPGANIIAIDNFWAWGSEFRIVYSSEYRDQDGSLIEEFEATDVTQMPNAIYMDAIEILPGIEKNVQIKLKNVNTIASYQFSLQLPFDVNIVENTLINDRHDEHTMSVERNNYVVISSTGGVISGNDGAVINLKLTIPEWRKAGTYPIKIYNCFFAEPDGSRVAMPSVYVPITVKEPEKGDANGNETVTIADVVTIVNHIIGGTNDSFLQRSADYNNDGCIDISDAQNVLNKVLGRNSRQAPDDMTDPQ